MPDPSLRIELSHAELREIARYAVMCALPAVDLFERECPGDKRPRTAIEGAQAFADGAARSKALRDAAWAAQRAAHAARDAGLPAASEAARAALAAAGSAFLHPLAKATQVKHILGAAAYAARALELAAGDDSAVADRHIALSGLAATPVVRAVLKRYPPAPLAAGRSAH